MNTKTDVVVIGAGSIGVNTAYFLSKRGRQVTLLDKDDVCMGSSWGNSGLISPSRNLPLSSPGVISQGLRWMFDPRSPFYIKPRISLALWKWLWQFRAACTEEHQIYGGRALRALTKKSIELYNSFDDMGDLGFLLEKTGTLFLYATEDGYQHVARETELFRNLGHTVEDLDKAAVIEKLNGMETPAVAGKFFAGDAHLNPADFVTGLARKARYEGVEIETHTQVLGFTKSGHKVTGVQTNKGIINADEVVLAAGSWSTDIAANLGLNLPIQAAKGYSVSYEKPGNAPLIPIMLYEAKTAITPMGEILRVGGTLELAGIDLSINQKRVNALLQAAKSALPAINFDRLRIIKTWAGLRPTTPDGLPLLGRPKGFENLIIAAGNAMMGIATGPGTGLLAAQEILGEQKYMDTTMFDPNRFK